MIVAPCKDCKDRVLGCHSKCEKYIAFKKEMAKEKEDKRIYFENYYNTIQKRKNVRK